MDPWAMVFDFTLLPSRSQWPDLREISPFDNWDFLFQPEFAHGFLKWGAQVGYAKSWKELWLRGLSDALIHRNNLKQVDWQNSEMGDRLLQNRQRSILLKKFAEKIQTPYPVEAQVQLAVETLTHASTYLIPLDFKQSNKPEKSISKNSNNSKNPNALKSILPSVPGKNCYREIGLEQTYPKSVPAPWGPILTLSKSWAHRSFSERLSTPDVEMMARELARLPMKWDSSFLDEMVETLRSKNRVPPAAKPWSPEEIALLQFGNSLGASSSKEPKKLARQAKSAPHQGLDPNARVQLAEMAAGAGHEINNPLAILTGTIQRLQKEWNKPAEPSASNHPGAALELMLRQVQRVRTQIEELMWFSRPPEPNPVVTNFAELKRIWNESVVGVATEIPLSIRKPKNGSLMLDPIHFGRVARLVGEFQRQHLPKTGDSQPIFSLQKKGNTLTAMVSGPFPNWTPSQILGLFTPFFCPKGFGRSSGLHLPAARALAEKSGWNLSFVQGSKGTPGTILLEIPVLPAEKPKAIRKKRIETPKPQIQEKIRFRPVA